MHDDVKQELLEDNADDPNKMNFIEIISQPGYEFFAQMQQRRFIKTHFPFSLLPPSVTEQQAKVESFFSFTSFTESLSININR